MPYYHRSALKFSLGMKKICSFFLMRRPIFLQGKEYIFVANSDNLGAIVDLSILSLFPSFLLCYHLIHQLTPMAMQTSSDTLYPWPIWRNTESLGSPPEWVLHGGIDFELCTLRFIHVFSLTISSLRWPPKPWQTLRGGPWFHTKEGSRYAAVYCLSWLPPWRD